MSVAEYESSGSLSDCVDWNLGLLLGEASLVGAVLGAVLARQISNLWLQRIFLSAVLVLALKVLFLDETSK
jgi:uncharacterized membrane protein YfcA